MIWLFDSFYKVKIQYFQPRILEFVTSVKI